MAAGVTAPPMPVASQRSIYDLRYLSSGYDGRANVRVLTAEALAFAGAIGRARRALATQELSLLDWGFGTGRVTLEMATRLPQALPDAFESLHVVGYDVASEGLRKSADTLLRLGFRPSGSPLRWSPDDEEPYVCGSLRAVFAGRTVTVTLVHGCETASREAMVETLLGANAGLPFAVTTSWYSGLGHLPTQAARSVELRALDELTDESGELVIAVSATGDRVEHDRVEVPGVEFAGDSDLLYRTELGQLNFWHVFGTDLIEHLDDLVDREKGQTGWIEAIRFPGDEFGSREEEEDNYAEVRRTNEQLGSSAWTPEDFARCHTVAALRSRASSADRKETSLALERVREALLHELP